MNKNIIKEQLQNYGFEVQPISFHDITKNGEINCLQNESLPECEATSLLMAFPDFFIIHKIIMPKLGIFFVKCCSPNDIIKDEVKIILKKYFPERLIIITQKNSGELSAHWFHLNNSEISLKFFLKNEMGI